MGLADFGVRRGWCPSGAVREYEVVPEYEVRTSNLTRTHCGLFRAQAAVAHTAQISTALAPSSLSQVTHFFGTWSLR
jgi:hypothetical protein